MTNLRSATAEMLGKYLADGGLLYGMRPEEIRRSAADRLISSSNGSTDSRTTAAGFQIERRSLPPCSSGYQPA
jgi:hypothetical protein